MPKTRYNADRQVLAKALRTTFSDETIGKMLGIPPCAVRHLCAHEFKGRRPSITDAALANVVGTIFKQANAAGERAIAQALREAADALERGAPEIKDRDL